MMEYPLFLFRVMLALTAWLATLFDIVKHKDLKLVFFGYTFLVVGSVSGVFYILAEKSPLKPFFLLAMHVFAVLFSGVFFALTAYAVHKKICQVEEKTKKAMGK